MPINDCEEHFNVKTSGPVCLICLQSRITQLENNAACDKHALEVLEADRIRLEVKQQELVDYISSQGLNNEELKQTCEEQLRRIELLMEGCEEGTTPVLTRIARLEGDIEWWKSRYNVAIRKAEQLERSIENKEQSDDS